MLRGFWILTFVCLCPLIMAGCGADSGTPGDANDPALGSDAEAEAAEAANPAPVNE